MGSVYYRVYMSAQRINITMPDDVLAQLDAHTSNRSEYITNAVRRQLVRDALATIAQHHGGTLPYATELDGIEDDAA